MPEWTLERELCTIAERSNLAHALNRLGLIDTPELPFDVVTTRDWHRSGAETYALLFEVRQADTTSSYLVKACIAWSPGESLDETFHRWLDRRRLLEEMGVSTPRLVGVGKALLVEEHLPCDLPRAIAQAGQDAKQRLLVELGRTAGLLASAGFAVRSTHDWRSRGDDVVLVDFGQDLGPPDVITPPESRLLTELTNGLSARRAMLTQKDLRSIRISHDDATGC